MFKVLLIIFSLLLHSCIAIKNDSRTIASEVTAPNRCLNLISNIFNKVRSKPYFLPSVINRDLFLENKKLLIAKKNELNDLKLFTKFVRENPEGQTIVSSVEGKMALIDVVVDFQKIGVRSFDEMINNKNLQKTLLKNTYRTLSLIKPSQGVSQIQIQRLTKNIYLSQFQDPKSILNILKNIGVKNVDNLMHEKYTQDLIHVGLGKFFYNYFHRTNSFVESVKLLHRIKVLFYTMFKLLYSIPSVILKNGMPVFGLKNTHIPEQLLEMIIRDGIAAHKNKLKGLLTTPAHLDNFVFIVRAILLVASIAAIGYHIYSKFNARNLNDQKLSDQQEKEFLMGLILEEMTTDAINAGDIASSDIHAIEEFKKAKFNEIRYLDTVQLEDKLTSFENLRKDFAKKSFEDISRKTINNTKEFFDEAAIKSTYIISIADELQDIYASKELKDFSENQAKEIVQYLDNKETSELIKISGNSEKLKDILYNLKFLTKPNKEKKSSPTLPKSNQSNNNPIPIPVE